MATTWIRLGALLGLLCLVPVVQAQQKSSLVDASLEDLMNVKVSTASKYLQLAKDAPAFSTVITHEEIQRYGYRTLADALQNVGGFFVTYDRNYSYVGVRGFGRPGDYNTRILVLVDGHRMNDAIYDSALVGTEFPLDIDLVERIEVIRGPGASLYGANAFFAVVNVITRSATQGLRVETAMQGMSFGGIHGRVTVASKLRDSDILVSASADHSNGQNFSFPELSDTTIRDADTDSSYSVFLRARRGHWTLQSLYGSRDKGVPTGAFDTALTAGTHTLDNRGYAELSYAASRDRWDVLAHAAYDSYYYAGSYLGIQDSEGISVVNRDYARADTVGTDFSLGCLLGDKHHLTTGGELRLNLRQAQGNYDVDPRTVWLQDERRSWITGGFVQDEYRPWRSLLLNIGLRLNQSSTGGTNVNPRLGLIWQPGTPTVVKILYGTAFRPPNAFEVYYTDGATVGTSAPRVSLTAEHIQSMEWIVERALGGNTRLVGSVFRNNISGLIGQTTDPLDGGISYQNIERVRATGLDLQLEGRFQNGVTARAAYTYVHTDDVLTDGALSNSPHTLLKAGVSAPLAHKPLNAALSAVYVSRRNTLQKSYVPSYALINFTLLAQKSGRPWSAALTIGNLLNSRYWDPGAVEHRQNAIAQDGRTYRLSLQYTWSARR